MSRRTRKSLVGKVENYEMLLRERQVKDLFRELRREWYEQRPTVLGSERFEAA